MFTGIVETVGIIKAIDKKRGNLVFSIQSDISAALHEDQSVSHNGVCLTVLCQDGDIHKVEAVEETLEKTNLKLAQAGDAINLERALSLGDRLDGHLVQGHVDTVGFCLERQVNAGSTVFRFSFPEHFAPWIIEKGSIAVNGISLTAFDVTAHQFSVAIIPYTLEHTMLSDLQKDGVVNLEFDLVGKYILRSETLQGDMAK